MGFSTSKYFQKIISHFHPHPRNRNLRRLGFLGGIAAWIAHNPYSKDCADLDAFQALLFWFRSFQLWSRCRMLSAIILCSYIRLVIIWGTRLVLMDFATMISNLILFLLLFVNWGFKVIFRRNYYLAGPLFYHFHHNQFTFLNLPFR